MANIKVLNNKFIIEGHTSKEECDTLTQVANVLDKSKEFKTIEYKNGYAEFERVVNSEELKFLNDPMQTTFSWDAHISQISFYSMGMSGESFSELNTSTNSGDMVQYMGNTWASYTMTVNVVLEEGYVLDTITGEDTTISNITNTTFDFAVLGNGTMPGNIVITSKVNNPNIQIPITKNGKTTLATKGTKNVEDIDINVNVAPTIQSLSITPSETSQTFNASNVDGYKPVNVSAIQTETPTVNLSLASGNQTVNASSGKYIKSLTITKPSTLVASNIKSGVNIAGVNGSLSPAKPEQTKSATITENGTTTVTPDSGQVLSSVSITTNVPTYITVASESALPSTAQEGTIAVVEGVAMYSVSCSSYADKIDTALHTYYSTNNGSTWTEFDSTGVLTSQATQIKFRMTYPSGLSAPGIPKILSEQLGMTLSHSFSNSGFDITSDNYILTEDITDVTYNENL